MTTTDTSAVSKTHTGSVPGPAKTPLVGQSMKVWADPLGYTLKMARDHGDVTLYHVRGRPVYMITDPEDVKHVFDYNTKNYHKSKFYDTVRPFFGNGLGLSEGAFWKRQRQIAQPAFHRQRIIRMAEMMATKANEMIDSWEEKADRGEPIRALDEFMKLGLAVVTRAMFSTEVNDKFRSFADSLTHVLKGAERKVWSILPVPMFVPTARNRSFKKALDEMNDVVFGVIRDRKAYKETAGEPHDDLLDMLMDARDDDGNGMTDEQLGDEIRTIFIAGVETLACSMAFTLYELWRHPEAHQRLRDEADAVLDGRMATFEDLPNLPYARMVFDEGMRLYPPVWTVSRQPLEDDTLGGHPVPAGATVQISPYIIHRDSRWWERPFDFYPEHHEPEKAKARPKYAYMPFGGGPRVCLGKNFALMEAQIALASIAQRVDLELLEGHKVEEQAMISLRPRDDVVMRVTRRARQAVDVRVAA